MLNKEWTIDVLYINGMNLHREKKYWQEAVKTVPYQYGLINKSSIFCFKLLLGLLNILPES